MAATSKNGYPKAIPLHPPEELAMQNSRLTQMNEELAAQARRLKEWKDELEKRAARLRQWTLRLTGVCVVTVLLAGGAVWFAFDQPRGSSPVEAPQGNVPTPITPASIKADTAPLMDAKKAPATLPDAKAKGPRTDLLEALGSLSATHLYQTHLNIGLLADGVESETYTVEEAETNLKSVIDMMKHVEAQQARLTKSGLDPDDEESIRQLQAVSAMLHLQIDSLRAYWASEEAEQANQYHLARKASWQGLSKVLGLEN